jgi:Tol biopolymer transport system component
MLTPARGPALGFLALCAALLSAEPARASCEVIDFSAVKQRTRSIVNGETVSTLVAAPAAAANTFVLLEADFGCVQKPGSGFDPVASNNVISVEVLKSVGGAFADSSLSTSFVSFPVPPENVQLLEGCTASDCPGLRFLMPDPGLAGPARITVTRGGNVVARIFELGVRTASCDIDAADTLVGTFTLLPRYNFLLAFPDGTPTLNTGLKAAIAGNGSLLLPMQHPLLGEAAVDAQVTRATGAQIDAIPDERFLRVLSRLFRPLPAIHRLVPQQPPATGQELYATSDVVRSTLQILPMVEQTSLPVNLHDLRLGPDGAGPVELEPITLVLDGATPVVALRSSEDTVTIGLSEELSGDLNADADSSDLLFAATDLATGVTTETGQAIAQVAASPARPVVAVSADVAAFFESEALSGYQDKNGDGSVDDLVVRVLKAGIALNPDVPVDTTAAAQRAIDGSALAISQGFVFFRAPEAATAPQFTSRVSENAGAGGDDTSQDPSIDAAGERVAYATRAGNLADGASGDDQQIVLTDLMADPPTHTLVSAGSSGAGNADSSDAAISAGGSHVAFASHATNLAPLSGGSSTQVVWERGLDVDGSSAFGFSLANFTLAPGDEEVAGVDYSHCTATSEGISFSFAQDGSVVGFLGDTLAGPCFHADFEGSYQVSTGDIAVGSTILIDASLSDVVTVPELPVALIELRLLAQLDVTAVDGASFDFTGEFDLLATTGAAISAAQVYARALGGTVQLVSAAFGGGAGSEASGEPALSGDGQLVAFSSSAPDLVPSDSNGASDVFVRNLASDSTERVSVSDSEAQANGASSAPAITPDGNLVAFASSATNLAGGDTNGASDVFVRDRSAGTTERVSVPASGGFANGASAFPDLSDDGRYVAFESAAQLVPEDIDALVDIYVRDRVEGTTERMSVASGGEAPNNGSFAASISGDGRYVVFASLATNLVPGTPAGTNVFRRDRLSGTVEWLSRGASASSVSTSPDADADGRTVAFDSDASLVPNDSLPVDVFVRDSGTGDDLNGDGDDADTVLQSFATGPLPPPGLQAGARVAASGATTGFGRVLVRTPEADEGNLNRNGTSLLTGSAADGDADSADGVLGLYDPASDQLVNLGLAGPGGALSDTTLCALVDEAEQNGAHLNGDADADDLVLVAGSIDALLASPTSKSLTNVGIAATQVLVAGTVCVFTLPAADGQLLTFYDHATGEVASSGLPATLVQVGPNQDLIAFRVPEALEGDLNNDGDDDDEVMHVLALNTGGGMITIDVTNIGLQAIDCDRAGCETFRLGSILADDSVSFVGTEQGETIDPVDCLPTSTTFCDFNGNRTGVDTVVHVVKTLEGTSPPVVSSVGSLALSSNCDQQTLPFPTSGPEGTQHALQLTECDAARLECPETREKQAIDGVITPLSVCEEEYDLDDDGVLDCDCATARRFVSHDSDGDGVLDPFDNVLLAANPEQTDADGDGVGDGVGDGFDTVPDSQLPCERSCDLDESGCIDQADVDIILAKVAAGGLPQNFPLQCGDRADRDRDLAITFLDASICKAEFSPQPCPAALEPTSGSGGGGCGIGVELAALLPLLMAARRRRKALA